MMGSESFLSSFILNCIIATLVAGIVFTIPGYFIAHIVSGKNTKNNNLSLLLFSPLLGMATYGIYSLLFNYIFQLHVVSIIISWILFTTVALIISKKQTVASYSNSNIPWIPFLFLLVISLFISTIPAFGIFPMIENNGIFVEIHIHDHVKIAIVDAIAREGLPPLSPYYAPAGERIELIYYYGWHYLVALVKMLTGSTGWQAEVAMVWYTSFAGLLALAAITIRVGGNIKSGFLVLALSAAFSLRKALLGLVGPFWKELLLQSPPVHGFELFLKQMAWAPQHVFSALCVVLLLFLAAELLRRDNLNISLSMIIGLVTAQALSSSIYVGGVALAMVFPLLILSIKKYIFTGDRFKISFISFVCIVTTTVLFSIPVLRSCLSGTGSETGGHLLSFAPYLSTHWFPLSSPWQYLGHIILFWILYLPLELGVVYILGILAIISYKPQQEGPKIFYSLSCATIFGFLVAVQFVQSSVMNNDFGWRSIMVPIFLLEIWAAVVLSKMQIGKIIETVEWRKFSPLVLYRNILIPFCWILLGVAIIVNLKIWHKAGPHTSHVKKNIQQHVGLFAIREAWEKIQEVTLPGELVQFNPSRYGKTISLTNQPMQMALFGDRPVAFASLETANVYTHAYDKKQKMRQKSIVNNLFSANPKPDNIRYAHDVLKVKGIIIDKHDAVWNNSAIFEKTNRYVLFTMRKNYKIYLAKEKVNANQIP